MIPFDLVYADPPWAWAARSPKGEGRSAKNHYNVMSLQGIKDLPISQIAADRSVLCIWAIDSMIPEALALGSAWGFEYKTVVFHWAKTNQKSPGFFFGLGYYTRANVEQCLLFTRRKDSLIRKIRGGGLKVVDHSVPRLIVSPIGRHSEKPDEARIRLERLFGDVRRVELFARSRRPGWEAFGNQVEGSIKLGE
jgi:N6-adenosine-specific RNA methylase IME4